MAALAAATAARARRRASSSSPTAPGRRAERLAERHRRRAPSPLAELADALAEADVVDLLHRCGRAVIDAPTLVAAARGAAGRPPAGRTSTWPCPHDVDPAVADLPGVDA